MITLIVKHEGFSLLPYLCPNNIPTIGYGTTIYPDGRRVSLSDEPITKEYAEILLNDYCIREVYPVFDKIPFDLTLDQKRAISSLVYNWNAEGFLNSKLYRAICKKDWANVYREWDYGFKNNFNGLFKRRAEEVHYFMKDIK